MNNLIILKEDEAKEIFPKNKKADLTKMMITEEGKYSVSKKVAAKKLERYL